MTFNTLLFSLQYTHDKLKLCFSILFIVSLLHFTIRLAMRISYVSLDYAPVLLSVTTNYAIPWLLFY